MKLWQKALVGIVCLIFAVFIAALWLGWSLSVDIAGDRLARIQSSPPYQDGAFVNQERQVASEFTWDYVVEQFFGEQQREPAGEYPVIMMAHDDLKENPPKGLRSTWLGHSSVLVEIDGHRILTDPVLSERASPFQFIGPKRFHPPPIQLDHLTGIDAVVISHDHYSPSCSARHRLFRAARDWGSFGSLGRTTSPDPCNGLVARGKAWRFDDSRHAKPALFWSRIFRL